MTKRPYQPLTGKNQVSSVKTNKTWQSLAKRRNGKINSAEKYNLAEHLRLKITSQSPQNDNYQNDFIYSHNIEYLSSVQLSTEGCPFNRFSLSSQSLLIYGALIHKCNIALVRRALKTVVRGCSSCGNDECPHCMQFIGVSKPVSDLAVLAFLMVVDPQSVSAWASELNETLLLYETWPTNNFTVVCYRKKIRIRVVDRVVVAVTAMGEQKTL